MDYEERLRQWVSGYGDWFADEGKLRDGRMTADLYPYTHLFQPIQVNGVKIRNRIVMGPMGNICMADETGRPSNKMIEYFVARARGGVGLITSGLIPVSHGVDPSVTEPGDLSYFPRIDRSRTNYAGWRILAENCHAHGARFFIQLTPGLGRVGSPECLVKKYKLPISSYWNPNFYIPEVPCRPLTNRECWRIIKNAGQAAADAKGLLIDGVYLHGHEGYLLEQMTNPAFNRRKWGKFADWQAFGIELVREIRKRTGPRYPIMYRIDLSLALNATYGERMQSVKGLRRFRNERTVEMTLEYMVNLVRAGVDMFDVDLGCYDNWWLPHPPASMPPGCYLEVAKIVKDYFAEHGVKSNAGQDVPVVAVGKLGYPDLAERALREGMCDMVMLARPLLADPEWPNKAYAGRVSEIIPCIGDQEGCLNEFLEGGHPQCAVNPRTGFEELLAETPPRAEKPKRVAVVGAGPAGVVCATTAARRGHRVTLYDRNDKAGGTLIPGCVPKIKYDVANYVDYLNAAVERHARDCDLTVWFRTDVSPEDLRAGGFDAVVVCAGAKPCGLPVPGADLPHVIQAVDVLRNPALAEGKGKIVIVGGGSVGCETAYFLAYELGKDVTVVEMLPYFMKGVCTANRGHLIHHLERKGVRLLNCATVQRIGEREVVIARNVSPTVPDPYVTWRPILPENVPNPLARPIREEWREETLAADLVVLAVGMKPDESLYEACVRERVAAEVHNLGDSFSVGRVFEAVKAGYRVGLAL